jgi:hypothetical protein
MAKQARQVMAHLEDQKVARFGVDTELEQLSSELFQGHSLLSNRVLGAVRTVLRIPFPRNGSREVHCAAVCIFEHKRHPARIRMVLGIFRAFVAVQKLLCTVIFV